MRVTHHQIIGHRYPDFFSQRHSDLPESSRAAQIYPSAERRAPALRDGVRLAPRGAGAPRSFGCGSAELLVARCSEHRGAAPSCVAVLSNLQSNALAKDGLWRMGSRVTAEGGCSVSLRLQPEGKINGSSERWTSPWRLEYAANMRPVDIQQIGEELAIKWDDGSEDFVRLATLRRSCPCADCKGETDILGKLYKGPDRPMSPQASQLRSIATVGGYAIQPIWADGHASGIFPFDLLKKI